jgi:hypothetical protein
VERIERIASALRSLDLGAGVTVEGRTFVGPEDALSRLRDLEGIVAGLLSRDLFELYDRGVAHDGVFDEDIKGSGRYYAYLLFELKGATPEEKEAALAKSLEDLMAQYGKDAVLGRIPGRIEGRQVSEALTVRPEPDEFPAFYSKARTAYAEKMALEELPKAIAAGFREDQERILDSFDWTTVRIEEAGGEVTEICGDAYALSDAGARAVEPYREIWASFVEAGPDGLYDIEVRTDGEYPPDLDEAIGRYYAYVRASLKGQASDDRRSALAAALPAKAVKALGVEAVAALFRETVVGDQVSSSLTLRPDPDDFPSYISAKRLEAGKDRLRRQIAINVQAEVLASVERALGGTRKYVILE